MKIGNTDKAEKINKNNGRRVFLATLQGERCLFSAAEDAKVVSIVKEGESPKAVAEKKGLLIVTRGEASDEARLTYARLWRAEHAAEGAPKAPKAKKGK